MPTASSSYAKAARGAIALIVATMLVCFGMLLDRVIVYPEQSRQVALCFGYMLTDPDTHKAQCGPKAASKVDADVSPAAG